MSRERTYEAGGAAMQVGVAGHRILAELDKLTAGLEEVVQRLQCAFPRPWTVVSALAEGADRLLTRRLLDREGTGLVVVLPIPPREYETDFATRASRREFRDLLARADETIQVAPAACRVEAYEAAGRTVLERAGVLVAVWDGRAPQGRGGTGTIVAEARQLGLPLAWIHAGNRAPGSRDPTALGGEQGEVTLERFPEAGRPGVR